MLIVLYACFICIHLNKYLHTLIKHIFDVCPTIRCTFVKCGTVNLCTCVHIYVVIVIVILWFGYTRSALNIYYCK